MDLNGSSTESSAAGRTIRSSDTYVAEKLRLYLNGFIYHPRFIMFHVKGAGGLSQERFEGTAGGALTKDGLGTEYEFRTKVLPEHPYNLELYTLRATPLVRGISFANTRPVNSARGTIFRYAARPLSLELGYNVNAQESRVSSAEAKTASVTGGHVAGPTTTSVGYSRTDSRASPGVQTAGDNSFADNTISLGKASLFSGVRQSRLSQSATFDPGEPGLATGRFSWMERFNAALPGNLSTSASYQLRKDAVTREQTATSPKSETANETRASSFTLSHKLYESVRTNYSLRRSSSRSSTGDTTSVSNAVNGVYTKKIPDGMATLGVSGARTRIDQKNAPLIVGETHSARLFGDFTLAREGIDPETISISAVSDTGALIGLARDTHYIVQPSGAAVLVTIVSLPSQLTSDKDPEFVYAFSVTYALLAGTVGLELDTLGYNAGLSLFDSLINPYYTHQRSTQAVLSGSIPGGAQDLHTDLVGVALRQAPYTLVSEYRNVASDLYPSRSRRNLMEYSDKMTDTATISLRAQFVETVYSAGRSGDAGYTENVAAYDARLRKTVPRSRLSAGAGASYSKRRATLDTELYSATANLAWMAGKLSVNLGASISRSRTSAAIEKQTVLSQYYYLTVSRKLF